MFDRVGALFWQLGRHDEDSANEWGWSLAFQVLFDANTGSFPLRLPTTIVLSVICLLMACECICNLLNWFCPLSSLTEFVWKHFILQIKSIFALSLRMALFRFLIQKTRSNIALWRSLTWDRTLMSTMFHVVPSILVHCQPTMDWSALVGILTNSSAMDTLIIWAMERKKWEIPCRSLIWDPILCRFRWNVVENSLVHFQLILESNAGAGTLSLKLPNLKLCFWVHCSECCGAMISSTMNVGRLRLQAFVESKDKHKHRAAYVSSYQRLSVGRAAYVSSYIIFCYIIHHQYPCTISTAEKLQTIGHHILPQIPFWW